MMVVTSQSGSSVRASIIQDVKHSLNVRFSDVLKDAFVVKSKGCSK